ncbi:unnamed protein product, partial [Ectocarpus sp. 8 AP-2014]
MHPTCHTHPSSIFLRSPLSTHRCVDTPWYVSQNSFGLLWGRHQRSLCLRAVDTSRMYACSFVLAASSSLCCYHHSYIMSTLSAVRLLFYRECGVTSGILCTRVCPSTTHDFSWVMSSSSPQAALLRPVRQRGATTI